jgi:hypothetical protein
MKLMLAMSTPTAWAGRVIPIGHSPFVIGREPGCHLRANSPTVGGRHCAVLVRGEHVFVRDFAGSPGTCVNDQRVPGQLEVHDHDHVRVGGLEFTILVEEAESARPQTERLPPADPEEAAANLLLALEENEPQGNPPTNAAAQTLPAAETHHGGEPHTPSTKPEPASPQEPDTAAAAGRLLARFKKHPGRLHRGPAPVPEKGTATGS